ncbi:hypothetical protein [Mesorhizobium sp. M0701]|uniref:hypothetical protein n=1 Tax=Mesorhizobium sp. M0701 TaxID=2956989 RepID=UPI0033381096
MKGVVAGASGGAAGATAKDLIDDGTVHPSHVGAGLLLGAGAGATTGPLAEHLKASQPYSTMVGWFGGFGAKTLTDIAKSIISTGEKKMFDKKKENHRVLEITITHPNIISTAEPPSKSEGAKGGASLSPAASQAISEGKGGLY